MDVPGSGAARCCTGTGAWKLQAVAACPCRLEGELLKASCAWDEREVREEKATEGWRWSAGGAHWRSQLSEEEGVVVWVEEPPASMAAGVSCCFGLHHVYLLVSCT